MPAPRDLIPAATSSDVASTLSTMRTPQPAVDEVPTTNATGTAAEPAVPVPTARPA